VEEINFIKIININISDMIKKIDQNSNIFQSQFQVGLKLLSMFLETQND